MGLAAANDEFFRSPIARSCHRDQIFFWFLELATTTATNFFSNRVEQHEIGPRAQSTDKSKIITALIN